MTGMFYPDAVIGQLICCGLVFFLLLAPMIMDLKAYLLFLSAFIVFVGRFAVPGHDLSWAGTYEALAHIWVGVMLTVMFAGVWLQGQFLPAFQKRTRQIAFLLLLSLTALEVVMFLYR